MRTLYLPTAVPGESWIQYSESALVNNLCHFLTASYLNQVTTGNHHGWDGGLTIPQLH